MQQLTEKKILSVTDLNRTVKKLLETEFNLLWIEGEISNLSKPQSGHVYFTLKDAEAQVRCALFRARHQNSSTQLENGMHILVCARISLYEGRGDYQLIIEHVEERGEGLLRRRLEQLKQELAKEGLFDTQHKMAIPRFPKRIGVVTSPTGAAIKDVLSVLKRRFAAIPVIIYPSAVQGETAANQIAAAISLANVRRECDVLIICRGGGSLEDLWSFNEEIVARAIFQSTIPTVSAVGHEVDFTIADLVADLRAPTPSAAAELLSPNKKEMIQKIAEYYSRLTNSFAMKVTHQRLRVENFEKRLVKPHQILQKWYQSIDFIELTLKKNMVLRLAQKEQHLKLLTLKLQQQNPKVRLQQYHQELAVAQKLLTLNLIKTINQAKSTLQSISRSLNIVNPLNTLERGYSIASKENSVIEDIDQIHSGDEIKVEIRTGYLHCTVNHCQKK